MASERADTAAPALEHAAAVGHALGFGPVTGIFVRDIGSVTRTVQGLLFLGLFLAPCLFAGFLEATSAVPNWVELVVVAVAVAGLVPTLRGMQQPGRRTWVYLFDGGIAVADHRGRVRQSARWTEIHEADWQWDSHYESSGYSLVGYRLRPANGPVITLPATLQNAQEPYAPISGLLRTLPGAAGEMAPKLASLAESLDQAVVRPLARRVLDRLAAGETVRFGPAVLDRAGLTYGRKPPLNWADITGWQVDNGELRIERAQGRRLSLTLDRIPGGWILVRVLTEPPEPA